jgi:hypothetical protein
VVEPQPEDSSGGGADTTAPNITSVTLSNSVIYLKGCSSHEQSTTLTVYVTDPSGIGFAGSVWSLGDEGGSVVLNYVGADRYSGFFGNVSTTGTMSITGTIIDNAGNYAGFSKTVTVENCLD